MHLHNRAITNLYVKDITFIVLGPSITGVSNTVEVDMDDGLQGTYIHIYILHWITYKIQMKLSPVLHLFRINNLYYIIFIEIIKN